MREQAKFTLDEAAARLDKTRSALQRIEAGETRADVHLVRSMMDLYDQYDPDLLDQARYALKPGWWVAYGMKDQGYVALESEAHLAREVTLLNLPGLLQIESYMRELFNSHWLQRSPQEIQTEITIRLLRQRRLTDEDNPLSLECVINEAALRRAVGGPTVMREQLRHLIEVASLPTVTLQVLPDSAEAHAIINGTFLLLAFPEPDDQEMLYIEYPTAALHIEDDDQIQEAKVAYEHLRHQALDLKDSVSFIRQVLTDWDGAE
ncbi:helix-turn-helix protein [Goodfellowiella coeruleoviolacea]|uniref:Helix-turn-helix protein n=2 Tax=Goodfellowiella coeruleoviolacea TaxID=334858 RepID=A0AAE3KGI8_9PSEU|nr:helix-turn-helix protein [Goodfellowiella coeruleoviolacea]